MAEDTGKGLRPVSEGGMVVPAGGLVGALERVTLRLGAALSATQQWADGTVAAMGEVAKAAEETMSKVEEMKSSQVSPEVGATSQPSQPLKEITAGLLQQAGRR